MQNENSLVSPEFSVTVVIATLGIKSVVNVISALNNGSIAPFEVLICIPQDVAYRLQNLEISNVRILHTPCYGQVAQRALGFNQVRTNLVLQLDDDIELRHDCLEKLIRFINTNHDLAVAPKMHDKRTLKYHTFMTLNLDKSLIFQKVIFWIVNGKKGYRPGKIGRAGVNMGLPEYPENWSNLEWLPGGCVLHWRENLILFDFYPLTGKAFAEDLFHSYLLRKKRITLSRCGKAVCYVDFSNDTKFNIFGVIKWYLNYAKALRKFLMLHSENLTFLYLYRLIFLYLYLFLNLLNRLVNTRIRGL